MAERAVSGGTIAELAEAIRARRLSPVEATRSCLDRIERLDGKLRSFITVDAEGALATARKLEAELVSGGWRGPLHGVPLAHKDLFATPGLPTSCGTKTPEYLVGAPEATALARLGRAGSVGLGKLNMSELARGPFGDNVHHGDVQNPWRAGHISGGSSSGSAVAVAAGFAAGALGTDTGGSIRLPAACCGVVGLKPTYGRVSRAGVMPLAWSLDHVGPLARTVRDCALLLAAIAGHDPLDATSSRRDVPDYLGGLEAGVRGLTIGVPENHYFDGLHPEIDGAVRRAVEGLAGLGARVTWLRVPDPRAVEDAASIISACEAAAVHGRLIREHPEDVGGPVRARIEAGFHISAHDYLQALRLRSRATREFVAEIFAGVDVLVAPVIPEPAPALADVKAGSVEDVVRRMGRFSRLTRPFNGLGLPALAVPCGLSSDGRPLAFQIVGRPFDEATVLRVGHAWETAGGGAAAMAAPGPRWFETGA